MSVDQDKSTFCGNDDTFDVEQSESTTASCTSSDSASAATRETNKRIAGCDDGAENKHKYVMPDEMVEQALEEEHPVHIKDFEIQRAGRKDTHTLMGSKETGERLEAVMESMLTTTVEEDERKRENANINAKLPAAKMHKIASELSKEYYLDHYLPAEQAKAHRAGDIHIHDLDFLSETFNCLQMDLGHILKGGWETEHGFLREPKRIISAAALAAITLQVASVNQFGGVSHNAFDYSLAPYVALEFKRQYSNSMSDALLVMSNTFDSSEREKLKEFYSETEKRYHLCPKMDMQDEFIEREREYLRDNYDMSAQQLNNLQSKVYDLAYHKTDSLTHEAMVSMTSNVSTMTARAAGQVVFASVNLGTDISAEGRMVTRQLLLAMDEGLGHGETCIFPIVVFKLKAGVSYEPEDPNYDLFKLACRVSAKRLYPNFVNLDASYNKKYLVPGKVETEIATMGCRTRTISNVYDPDHEQVAGRGNLFFVTINLPRLAIEADHDIDKFYNLLDDELQLCLEHLFTRFEILADLTAEEIPFHMLQGGWLGADHLKPTDKIREVLKHGSMSIGFVGLAETLVALIGKHHGESPLAQKLGLQIVGHIRAFTDAAADKYKLNFSTFGTPAESTAGTFAKKDRKRFGIIPGVTDREYYTNSSHVPVYYDIDAFSKIKIEGPYHALENAGHIAYVEMDGDPLKNLSAFEAVVRCFHDNDCGYFSINHPVDQDKLCGYVGIIDDTCPKCGRHEGEPMSEEKAYEIGLLRKTVSDNEMDAQAEALRYCCY